MDETSTEQGFGFGLFSIGDCNYVSAQLGSVCLSQTDKAIYIKEKNNWVKYLK